MITDKPAGLEQYIQSVIEKEDLLDGIKIAKEIVQKQKADITALKAKLEVLEKENYGLRISLAAINLEAKCGPGPDTIP